MEKLITAQAASYSSKPFSNVLVVIKVKDDAYPYHLAYVQEINAQGATVLVWNYVYEKLSDARTAIQKALTSLRNQTVEANFSESYTVPLKEFSELDFVYIDPLERLGPKDSF
jgi:hypothetical protein